ncbi:MAG: leucine-rich repeat protein [Candidatus Caccovivens sp.]
MKNKDLEFIKKHYGEDFSHLCRELFPTLLEQEGLLSEVISKKFVPTRSLAEDLKNNLNEIDAIDEFKSYIFSLVDVEKEVKTSIINKTPEELLSEAGYILYPECKTEEDIQRFKKYYAPGEALCTFRGGRLNTCRVWFAVKKNVDEIKREDFKNPKRQDEYGTSVISIQFTKSGNITLSIKNRYNHTVNNPDCTFGNNLENIAYGLTDAFEKTYDIHLLENNKQEFELNPYVLANDGKFYRYNFESNGIYFCENNVIIEHGDVKTFNKDTTLVIDNFVVDLKNKTIKNILKYHDSFIDSIGEIQSINTSIDKDGNKILVIKTTNKNEVVEITINKHNRIIGYKNPNVTTIGNDFLPYCELHSINLPNVAEIGDGFLYNNWFLHSINLPKVTKIGNGFLYNNLFLQSISLPNVTEIGNGFLYSNETLSSVNLPNVNIIGDNFLYNNEALSSIDLPNVTTIGDKFLYDNKKLQSIDLPNVTTIGNEFLLCNENLKSIDFPYVTTIGNKFLYWNKKLQSIDLPNVYKIGNDFLKNNKILEDINFHNVTVIGDKFLCFNENLKSIDFPYVTTIGNDFLPCNRNLKSINIPNVITIGNNFLNCNIDLKSINIPNVTVIGNDFLCFNKNLKSINIPNVTTIGDGFLCANDNLKSINMHNVTVIGNSFLYSNNKLKSIDIPNAKEIGKDFLKYNKHFNFNKNNTSKNEETFNK